MFFREILPHLFCVVFIYGCKTNSTTEVAVSIKGVSGKKIYLYKEAFINEQSEILDSLTVIDYQHPVKFNIVNSEQRLYSIRPNESSPAYYFINDNPAIELVINHINGKYSISKSPASESYRVFIRNQEKLASEQRLLWTKMQTSIQNSQQRDSLIKLYNEYHNIIEENKLAYADSVKNAAAFMATYLSIDFGKDLLSLKKFVDKGAVRFPDYKPVLLLKKESYEMIKILSTDLKTGEKMPIINLPTKGNKMYTTDSLEGKFYLLQIWAPWINKHYLIEKDETLAKVFKDANFAIVNVAFEDDIVKWENYIKKDNTPAIQLIDVKMWQGETAKRLLFDSIPYNFFIGPDGRIIANGIDSDSMVNVISKYLN